MSRYIDADALKTKKRYSAEFHENVVAVAEIDWMPTIDAVQVVRCGECKHRGFHRAFNCRGDEMTDYPENSKCPMQAGLLIMPDDFYCKYGERKDGESDGET